MKKILLFCLAVITASLTNAFAGLPTFCITNSNGEQTTLTVTGRTGSKFLVSGEIDYTVFGGTIWPCSGTYNAVTRQLNYTATNPDPDSCVDWANVVEFTYTVYGVYLDGSFINDCGLSDVLVATVTKGSCTVSPVKLKQGEYGSSGSHKLLRSRLPVPKGQSLEEILGVNSISITPNPVSKVANINITLATSSKISINIYNKEGILVYTLVNGIAGAGKHSYAWNLQTKNSGMAKPDYYIVKLVTKDGEQSVQILVTR